MKSSRPSRRHDLVQGAALVLWVALAAAWVARIVALHPPLAVLVAGLLSAWIASDVASGVVHWLADTWGSERLPLIGPALVRPFRDHHVDPLGITRHPFVETNGNTALVSLPVLGLATVWPAPSGSGEFAVVALGGLAAWTLATNQIHKWAHAPAPPAAIVPLQRLGIVLPPAHHALHHALPNDGHYCITTGWCNGPLEAVGFFRAAERAVTASTGLVPRAYLRVGAARLPAEGAPDAVAEPAAAD